MALRLNSDVIRWEERDGRIIKDKIPAAPGNKWVGLIMLFSAETGEPLAIFPDGFIQGLRVAASSALGWLDSWRGRMRPFWGYLVPVGRRGAHARMRAIRAIKKIPVHSPTKIIGRISRRSRARAQYSRGGGCIWRISCRSRTSSLQPPTRYLDGAARVVEARHACNLREDYGAGE